MTKKFFAAIFAALSVMIFSAAQASAAPLADIGIYDFFVNMGYKIDKNNLLLNTETNQIVYITDLPEKPLLPAGYPMTHNTTVYADGQSGKVSELTFIFYAPAGKNKITKFLSKAFNALDSGTFGANKEQIERHITALLKGNGNIGLGELSNALSDGDSTNFFLASANRGYTLSKNYISEKVLVVNIQTLADPSMKEKLIRAETEHGSMELAKQLEPLLEAKKYSEAADLCKTLIQRQPDNGAGYYGLGFCYSAMGKHAEAIEQFKKSVSLTPNSETYKFMGISYAAVKDADNAIASFKKAIELNPQNHQAYSYMGTIYMNAFQDFNKAAEALEKAIAIYPRREYGYYYRLGLARIRLGKFSEAIDSFNEAAKLNAKDYNIYIMRAFSYENLGNRQQAKKDYETALKLNPSPQDAADLRKKIESL